MAGARATSCFGGPMSTVQEIGARQVSLYVQTLWEAHRFVDLEA